MKKEIETRYKKDLLVLLDEEYGYRKWFWFPEMRAEELEQWWGALETVEPYFMTPEPLPGELYQVEMASELNLFIQLEKSSQFYSAHTHCDDDSILIKPDKTRIYHKGYEHS